MQDLLSIQDLSVLVEGKKILEKINLQVNSGEVHVVMGPNGSGKSSLALALAGHPAYKTVGQVFMAGQDLFSQKADGRAKMGLFLTFQNPVAIPGVALGQLLWSSYINITGDRKTDIRDFYERIKKQAKLLGLKEEILERFVNEGFSGGEKKKAEILILLNLKPKFVILDEIDSGLDVDTLKNIAKVINRLKKQAGVILITHNTRILTYIKPNFVHIMKEGRIIKSGDHGLATEIEEKGYGLK